MKLVLTCPVAVIAFMAGAQPVPPLMNYQGRLANADGTPFATADYELRVSLYDAATNGTLVWGPEVFDGAPGTGHGPRLPVVQGYFNVMLGPVDLLERSIADAFGGSNRFVEVTVRDRAPIHPRQRILAAPYALMAASVAPGSISDQQIGIVSSLSAPDGGPTNAFSIDLRGRAFLEYGGVYVAGSAPGNVAFSGSKANGTFPNWLSIGATPDFVRLLGARSEVHAGYGIALGENIASPVVWFYAFEDRNCFQVRAVEYNSQVEAGTPLLTVRRLGGGARVGIGTENPGAALDIRGEGVATAGFRNTCDRDAKRDFATINCQDILARVVGLPIQSWVYKEDPMHARHVGPVAQDFHAAFEVGADDRTISTVDSAGIALAAVKGLHELFRQKEVELESLRTTVMTLQEEVTRLRKLGAMGNLPERNGR